MYLFTALNPLSCTAYKNTNAVDQREELKIDVDGSGPLRPFPVTCEFYGKFNKWYETCKLNVFLHTN